MTETEALAELRAKTAADVYPTLSDPELTALLSLAKRPDSLGRSPSDIGWEGTWDVNAAAAEGWRWKAGKVTAGYDISVEGNRLNRSQLHAHCLAMVNVYATRTLPPPVEPTYIDPVWIVNR